MRNVFDVWLIDDNETDLLVNGRIIEITLPQVNLVSYRSAKVALDSYKASYAGIATKPPFVILLDVNMPLIDGFEFVTEFNKLIDESQKVFIFLLTSRDGDAYLHQLLQAPNVSGLLNKPLEPELLKQSLLGYQLL